MPPKKSIEGPFKKGAKVKARWSGSNSFFDGKILEVAPKTCKVEFEDGTVFTVKHADIKSPRAAKIEVDVSPKRTRSRSRSAGRPRSRSRSPARNEKKETVAKRGRPSKEDKKRKSEESSKTINNSLKKDETDSIVKSSLTREKIGSSSSSVKEESKSSISSVITTNSITKSMSLSLEKEIKEPSETRFRSTRLAALRSADIPATEKKSGYETRNAVSRKEEKYSDEEESEEEEIKVIPKGPSKLLQTALFIFTLLKIILMPTVLLFLAFSCTKKQCTVLEVPQFYSRWRDVGNALKFPLPSVILFHLAICLLSIIPLGKKVKGFPFGPKGAMKEYTINGIFILLLSVLIFGICSYFGVYMNWGYDKFRALTLSILLYCMLCSLIMHIVSLVKGDGIKESKIPLIGNFFNGVYINPFLFGKVDVKTSFVRAGLIGSVLLNLSIVLKFFLMKGYVTIPLACTAAMHIFFVLDYFIREEKMLSTATYTSDCVGYGFMMTTSFLIPIGLALQTVYLIIFETKHATPHYCYAAMVALFFFGYYLYMMSGNLKHNFRSNPFSPSLSDVESIPTSQKKRLISSRLWGVVRHPNYLGLIIMAFAWTLPCGFSHFVPYGPLIMLILALIVRIFRVEAECKEKYGPAWKNYTEKVRSRLIPYIF